MNRHCNSDDGICRKGCAGNAPCAMTQHTKTCPTCGSPDPKRHPAVQFDGEVQICGDAFHTETPTPRTDTLLSRGGLRPKPLTDLCRELKRELADMTADYLRRHKDVGDMLERALAAETKLATASLELSAERDAVAQYIGERNGLQKRLNAQISLGLEASTLLEELREVRDTLRTQLAQAQNEALERAKQAALAYRHSTYCSYPVQSGVARAIESLKSPNSAEGEPG